MRKTKPITQNRLEQYFEGEMTPLATKWAAPNVTPTGTAYSVSTLETIHIEEPLDNLYKSHVVIMEALGMILKSKSATATPFCTFVSTLAAEGIDVVKAIPVTIEPEQDGSFIASFVDAGISTGGGTLREATWCLQDLIGSTFLTLDKLKDDQLGPKMLRTKAVLMEFLCLSSQKHSRKIPQKS